jgi:hypothetical protein
MSGGVPWDESARKTPKSLQSGLVSHHATKIISASARTRHQRYRQTGSCGCPAVQRGRGQVASPLASPPNASRHFRGRSRRENLARFGVTDLAKTEPHLRRSGQCRRYYRPETLGIWDDTTGTSVWKNIVTSFLPPVAVNVTAPFSLRGAKGGATVRIALSRAPPSAHAYISLAPISTIWL